MEVHPTAKVSMPTYEVDVIRFKNSTPVKCSPCFICYKCLAGQDYFKWDDRKYCSDCFGTLYGRKCVLCKKCITGSSRLVFIYYENRTWHSECFKCSTCGNSLAGCSSSKDRATIRCIHCGTDVKF